MDWTVYPPSQNDGSNWIIKDDNSGEIYYEGTDIKMAAAISAGLEKGSEILAKIRR